MTELNGRVFTRLKQYDALPAELKREAERLEEHLTTIQTQLFETHRTKTLKSVYGVRTHELLAKIDAWVKQHSASTGGVGGVAHKGHVATTMKEQARDVKDRITGKDHDHVATREGRGHLDATHKDHSMMPMAPRTDHGDAIGITHKDHGVAGHNNHGITHEDHRAPSTTAENPQMNVGNYQTAASGTPATAPVHLLKPTDTLTGTHSPQAKKLLDALVLKGFVTPYKEDNHDETPNTADGLKNSELLVAVGKRITVPKNHSTANVWDLVDGAIFAGFVKRKAGLLEPIIHGKDEYAVVNGRMKNLTLFKKDVSHKAKLQLEGAGMKVSFDKTHYENGVKVWTSSDSELFSLSSQRECDALVEALMAIGAVHDKGNGTVGHTTPQKVHDKIKDTTTADKHTMHGTHGTHGMHGVHGHENKAGSAAASKDNAHQGHQGVMGSNFQHGHQDMTGSNLQHGTHGMKNEFGQTNPTHGMTGENTDVNAAAHGQTMGHSMGLKTDYDALQQTHRADGVNEPTHYAP